MSEESMYYVVPDMQLIPQDKNMSCWYASGQMLISWRQRHTASSEIAHPDPSLVQKWTHDYDVNNGINNNELQDFAHDLGMKMLGPMTPSPQYIRDLLQFHGPLWVNGVSHITVIAGIRSAGSGYELLVYDPAKPASTHGDWVTFSQVYMNAPNTRLDASAASPTSMMCID
jgi:Papain-like cysteine protease AvrRpt2